MKKSIVIIILLIGFFSCTKDQGPVEPEIVITTVSFSDDVQPIFDANCSVCHTLDQEDYNGGLNLDADKAYNELVDIITVGYAPDKRVVVEDPTNSILWQKINNSMLFGANMPLGSNPLSQQDQDIIKVWIEEGALNN